MESRVGLLPAELKGRIQQWIAVPQPRRLAEELDCLLATEPQPIAELEDRFLVDLSFGTAGLRAEMGVGWGRMNEITVQQASQGLAMHLQARFPGSRVVVGYDHRHNSRAFAQVAAKCFAAAGCSVLLFPEATATPLIPAAVLVLQCALGVMVTASHNPAPDNGYKVYWSDGAQIRPPIDAQLLTAIEAQRQPVPVLWSLSEDAVPGDAEALALVKEWYIGKLRTWKRLLGDQKPLTGPIIYTPMHGLGRDLLLEAFDGCSLPRSLLHIVPGQADPDPDFPTIRFPNPEEGPKSLALAMQEANGLCRTPQETLFLMANDPDADRFAIAEYCKVQDAWRFYSGNEVATLLGAFLVERFVHRNGNGSSNSNEKNYLLASGVSSRFLGELVQLWNERTGANRFVFETTPSTGFKYLGSRGRAISEIKDCHVLLAFEEAIGYQVGDWHFDKDGISALLTMLGLLGSLDNGPGRDSFVLERELKRIYGDVACWPVEGNGYYFCRPVSRLKGLLAQLPGRISGLQAQRSNSAPAHALQITAFKTSPLLELSLLLDGTHPGWLILRSSGTEPKIKYYSELLMRTKKENEELRGRWREVVETLVGEILLPELNGLARV
jgi:phosphomannomutase